MTETGVKGTSSQIASVDLMSAASMHSGTAGGIVHLQTLKVSRSLCYSVCHSAMKTGRDVVFCGRYPRSN